MPLAFGKAGISGCMGATSGSIEATSGSTEATSVFGTSCTQCSILELDRVGMSWESRYPGTKLLYILSLSILLFRPYISL